MKGKELTGYLSHFITGIVVIIVVAVLIGISSRLPGIYRPIWEGFEVYHLVVLVFLLVIIGILFNIRPSAKMLLGYVLSNRGRRSFDIVEPLGRTIINIAYAAIIYSIAFSIAKRIIETYSTYGWILTLITGAFVVNLLIFLPPLFQSIRVYLENAAIPTIEQFVSIQEGKPFKLCPKCGYKNPPESKFCVNCGTNISEIPVKGNATQEESSYVICPKCGYKNPPESKFCVKCGTPLTGSEEPSTKKK